MLITIQTFHIFNCIFSAFFSLLFKSLQPHIDSLCSLSFHPNPLSYQQFHILWVWGLHNISYIVWSLYLLSSNPISPPKSYPQGPLVLCKGVFYILHHSPLSLCLLSLPLFHHLCSFSLPFIFYLLTYPHLFCFELHI